MSSNGIDDPDTIRPGSELRILPVKGLEYEVQSGETLADVAYKYQVDLGLLLIDILLRSKIPACKRLGASEVFLGSNEQRGILCLFCLGLIECRLEQTRIDLRQRVALFHMLPFGEQHLLKLAVDLGMNSDGGRRLHSAKTGGVNRPILSDRDRT